MNKILIGLLSIVLLLTGCGKSSDGGLFDMIDDPKTWSKTYEQYQNDSKYALKEENDNTIILTTVKPMKVYGVSVSPEIWFQKASNGGPPDVIYVIVGEEKSGKYTQKLDNFYENIIDTMIDKYTVTKRTYYLSPDGRDVDSDTPCMSLNDILYIPRPDLDYITCYNAIAGWLENETHKMELFFSMFSHGDSFSLRIAPKR